MSAERVFHLALREDWDDALAGGAYLQSTLGRSLEDEGFIHCSFADQVQGIADLVYRGRDDVVLLAIDLSRVRVEVRVENVEGAQQSFPHLYGPLPVDAVTQSIDVPLSPDGRLLVEPLLRSS